ncbi:SDR family NAD(P)-dependent oxidoreductase [Chitinophaga sancti]|uniref:3-oxoacyl-ACP reductase family protein n=1 Tax=Chitinophaga sancti TaxID=1004 RepID=A0A1K1QZ80_9BACT|nr:3-oxoacyl-ACP reductase family protein [Chitinophaga sancti]WQD62105.1 3-oxoacyl-ACP reductase family protein [Chitinophaga sancti]WQG92326.1 3-oxoacyl-ACP reductase family protein [Chitinophaga sancti]SFW65077.1 3-oxoacyl-[acyl-carrier protein] reductase [Chitinophaga sancti]
MEQKPLAQKVALVTGASGGLGRAIAFQLADAGATLIVNYNSNKTLADEVVQRIATKGGSAYAIQGDVSREEQVKALFEKINERVGTVDILVNNAGINPPKTLQEITLQDFQQSLDVNLTSSFLTTQQAIPGMIAKQYGRIINISSVAAQLGGVIGPHYAAAKAGMLGLTHSYAALLAKYTNITANAIAPALIETDMLRDNPNIRPTLIPIGRFGQPDEVAAVVLLLAQNGYITGQTINVNGGWYMS